MKIKDERNQQTRFKNGEMTKMEAFDYQIEIIFEDYNKMLKGPRKSDKVPLYRIGKITPKRVKFLIVIIFMLFTLAFISLLRPNSNERTFETDTNLVYVYSSNENYKKELINIINNKDIYSNFTLMYPEVTIEEYNEFISDENNFYDIMNNNSQILIDLYLHPQKILDLSLPIETLEYYNVYQILSFNEVREYIVNNEEYGITAEIYDETLSSYTTFNERKEAGEFDDLYTMLSDDKALQDILNNINAKGQSYGVTDKEQSFYFLDINNLSKEEESFIETKNIPLTALQDNKGLYYFQDLGDNQINVISNTSIDYDSAIILAAVFDYYSGAESLELPNEFYSDNVIIFANLSDLSNEYLLTLANTIYISQKTHQVEYHVILKDNFEAPGEIKDNFINQLIDILIQSDINVVKFNQTGNGISSPAQGEEDILIIPAYEYSEDEEVDIETYRLIKDGITSFIDSLNDFNNTNAKSKLVLIDDSYKYIKIKIKSQEDTGMSTSDLSV